MAELPNGTTLQYNTVLFPVTTETTSVSVRPIQDAADRGLKYNQYSLTVKSLFGGGTSALSNNLMLPDVRRLLTQPGQTLVYTNKGFGDLNINTGATLRDVKWGPIPKMLSWKPLGNNACELTWAVDFAISDCPQADYDGLLTWVYNLQYSNDLHGYTTKTHSGSIEIPRWRQVAGYKASFDRTPDSFLEQITPAVPFGFRRESSVRNLDEAKTKLTFSFVDREMVNALPEGVVEAQISHTTQNSKSMAFVAWSSTISASYTMAKSYPRGGALKHFAAVVNDRQNAVRRQYPSVTIVNTNLSLSEPDLHGQNSFSASCSWATTLTFQAALIAGLWQPVPGTDMAMWTKSMQATAWHPRGNTRQSHDQTDDVVVSICDPAMQTRTLTGGRGNRPTLTSLTNGKTPGGPPAPASTSSPELDSLTNSQVTPEGSWLAWRCDLVYEPVDQTVVHMPLPLRLQKSTLSNQPANVGADGGQSANPTVQRPTVQFRGDPLWYVRLVGFAFRAGFPIEPPRLLRLNGVDCVRVTDGNKGEGLKFAMTNQGGLQIYRLDWNLRYVLMDLPGSTNAGTTSLKSMYPTDSFKSNNTLGTIPKERAKL